MLIHTGLAIAGFLALFVGGEWLVRGAVALAARLGLPTLMISLTVVGFGTSMPEMLVSARAALADKPDIALGNVVGSNIANILLIIGLSALAAPMHRWNNDVRRDSIVMVLAGAAAFALVQFEQIGPIAGLAMVAILASYLLLSYVAARKAGNGGEFEETPDVTGTMTVVYIIAGMALLFAGAEALVRGAVGMARGFGVSEAAIGLSIVAVGTSLPELATSLVAAMKKHSDIAIGNVVGSNIFNIFGILGVTALIEPMEVAENFRRFDAPFMFGVSVVFAAMLISCRPIGRPFAALFLAGYAGYMALLFGVAG